MQLYLFNDTNADVLKKNRYFCHRKSEYKNILRMKTIVLSCGLLMIFSPIFAQNIGKDTIVSSKVLQDVVVSASNISRIGDHLVIYPNSQQRKHAVSGFGVLENLNIPGLMIDSKSKHCLLYTSLYLRVIQSISCFILTGFFLP